MSWFKNDTFRNKAFKLQSARELFEEYITRISKFVPCQILGSIHQAEAKKAGTKVWVCDQARGAKTLSSEQVAAELEQLCNSAVRELHIVIGDADGFSKEEMDELKPDLRWSFGPLTLPHELAAIVASEQIYRAWAIIKRLPYHLGH